MAKISIAYMEDVLFLLGGVGGCKSIIEGEQSAMGERGRHYHLPKSNII
jgi:hypothetical protein